MSTSFDGLISKVKECGQKTVSVAVAQDSAVLEAVRAAKDRGIANAVLVGDEEKIKAVAAESGIDISDFEIIHEPDEWTAALTAVKLAHDGKVDMYMKGLLETKTFLKSILDKEVGLRTGNPLSHVCVFDVPGIDQLLFFTDVAFMTYPTLEDKVHIIENTVEVAHACGIANPKVAPLAAVEVVNPKMPVTVEAAELTKMNEEGKITGCIVDGPLSLDLAIDPEAASQAVKVSVRPEEFVIQRDATAPGVSATVDDSVFLGLNTHYFVHLDSGEKVEIVRESEIENSVPKGTAIKLAVKTHKINVFTADGARTLTVNENRLEGVV